MFWTLKNCSVYFLLDNNCLPSGLSGQNKQGKQMVEKLANMKNAGCYFDISRNKLI